MAQADQTVQNATFPTVRADINDNLAALFSQSSGASAPTTTVAFQPWIDTSSSPAVWKVRNAANSGWITIGVLDATFAVGGLTPIANGGTGQTTASGAINALVPSQAGNASKALVTDGSIVSWGSLTNSQSFYYTTTGTPITWTKPSTGVVALVTIWGGGGGGGRNSGGGSGGGGGGACAQKLFQLADLPSTVTINIGVGGTGGTASTSNGTVGGTSTFGAFLSAYGGGGGGAGVAGEAGGGGGGTASAGIRGVDGGTGGIGVGSLGDGASAPAGRGAFGGGAGDSGTGGSATWGGGGGGATGGASVHGGAGGGTSTVGSVPGGGGGRGVGAAAGNGGAGAAWIVVW